MKVIIRDDRNMAPTNGRGPRTPRNFAGREMELLEAHRIAMRNELRIWWLRSLLEKDLATPDVYHFAKNQGLLRTFDQTPNQETMKVAMDLKITDLKKSLALNYRNRRVKTENLLNELDHRSYKLRKKLHKIRKAVAEEGY